MQPHEDEADVVRSPPGSGHAPDPEVEGGPPEPGDEPGEPPAGGDAERADGQDEARSAARERRERAREGRDRARQEGREQGRVEGLRAAVLVFARARLAPLSSEDAAAIAALGDERALTELVDTLAQAATVDEARAVLDAAIAGTRK